jgi:hypothetical protein
MLEKLEKSFEVQLVDLEVLNAVYSAGSGRALNRRWEV